MGKSIEILVICLIVIIQLGVAFWTYRQIRHYKSLIKNKKNLHLERYVLTQKEILTLSPREIVNDYRFRYDEWRARSEREKISGANRTCLLRDISTAQEGNDIVFVTDVTAVDSEALFMMHFITDDEAEIDMHIPAEMKEARLKDIEHLRLACDVQSVTDTPKSYINMSPGWCKRIDGDKWLLVTKCKIAII